MIYSLLYRKFTNYDAYFRHDGAVSLEKQDIMLIIKTTFGQSFMRC
jgi:hypothetical protein